MPDVEITQTTTAKGSEKFFSPKDLMASSASFLLDKGTPFLFGFLVMLGGFFITTFAFMSSTNLRLDRAETQIQASVVKDSYESDQNSLALQLESIKSLIEQGNARTERIEDYLLNSKE